MKINILRTFPTRIVIFSFFSSLIFKAFVLCVPVVPSRSTWGDILQVKHNKYYRTLWERTVLFTTSLHLLLAGSIFCIYLLSVALCQPINFENLNFSNLVFYSNVVRTTHIDDDQQICEEINRNKIYVKEYNLQC